jgi:hypothetical protein
MTTGTKLAAYHPSRVPLYIFPFDVGTPEVTSQNGVPSQFKARVVESCIARHIYRLVPLGEYMRYLRPHYYICRHTYQKSKEY